MRLYLIITVYLYLLSVVSAQPVFQKFYGDVTDLNLQDIYIDGEYIKALNYNAEYSSDERKISVYKFNNIGEFVSSDSLKLNLLTIGYMDGKLSYPINFKSDGGYAAASLADSNLINYTFVSSYDSSNNLLWQENTYVIFYRPIQPLSIKTLSNNKIVFIHLNGRTEYTLKKFNTVGLLEFEKTFMISSTLTSGVRFAENKTGDWYLSTNKQVIKTDSLGSVIWEKSFSTEYVTAIKPIGNNIIIGMKNAFALYDTAGAEKWIVNLGEEIDAVEVTSEGNVIVSTGKNILIYSPEGELLENYSASVWVNFIKRLTNGNILYSGQNFIAVTEPDGRLKKQLKLTFPTDRKEYFTGDYIPITWQNINVDYVNIYYSLNGGSQWKEIINYYPSGGGTFYWNPPFENNENVIIKISDNENEEVYDVADTVISVKIFDQYTTIAGNNITMWIGNNGLGSHDPVNDDSGLFWTAGNGARSNAVFSDGLVWGCKVAGEIRTNGNTYRNGLQAGKILSDLTADNPIQEKYKIYKIKKNWEYTPPGAERERYYYDYFNWPGELGAPYIDMNDDGKFTKGIDKPEIIGDETVFYVANDIDTTASRSTYGSDPIGLEFTTLAYAYNIDKLRDVVFKEYIVVNKSGKTLEDFYFGYWSDSELGNAGDDFIGCDPDLSMGYCYNSDNVDEYNFGTPPPAVGHMFLQGPLVEASENDSGKIMGKWRKGYKNLRMTMFTPSFKNFSGLPDDPILGDYRGTIQLYDILHGLSEKGDSIINPITNRSTVLPLSGNPEGGTGWYEGPGWPEGPVGADRRFTMSSGPLNIAPGDTQHVVVAILLAQGENNINSVTELKKYAFYIQNWWGNKIVTDVKNDKPVKLDEFSLKQNYPNPFNPSTTIEYKIPDDAFVSLIVYDILGREVKTLVNQQQKPGSYKVLMDGSSLASGTYFYRINYGGKIISRKMLLIK
ncbi:MAG: T9SS type A sorting domain-containing protein [Bacteroidetes bacterium]|nr:T9SS type A sorting domain-containing protein [Bacteroidota bacterium]